MAVFLGGARGHIFFVAVPMSPFSLKTEQFWPLVPPIGAVRTEQTYLFSGLQRGNTKSLLGLPLFLIRLRQKFSDQ